MSDRPDYTLPISIESVIIESLPIEVVAWSIGTIAVDIASQTVGNIGVDIKAATAKVAITITSTDITGNIPVDIKAQTIGNIGVDIKAQTVGNIGIDIKAATAKVGITILATDVTGNIPIDIKAQTVGNIGVDVKAQTVGNIGVDIKAQTLGTINIAINSLNITGNIPIDIKAQTIGNIGIDIKAQTLTTLNINISSQSAFNLNVNLAASAITLNINISSQSAFNLNVNIAASAATINVNITGSTTINVNISSQSAFNLNVNIAASAVTLNINISSQSAFNLNVNIAASGVTLNVNITGSTTINVNITGSTTLNVNISSITAGVTFNVNITGSTTINVSVTSSVAINIQTTGGTNIIIDKLTVGAYTERRSTLSNNGATPTSWLSITGVNRRSKFFPRGCRGFIWKASIYCKDIGVSGGTITLSFAPNVGMGAIFSATVTVPAGGAAAWREIAINRAWNYDSMHVSILMSSADIQVAYDSDSPDDYGSGDSGATWYREIQRWWLTVDLIGETVGDIPVSGTINTVEIPNLLSKQNYTLLELAASEDKYATAIEGTGTLLYAMWEADDNGARDDLAPRLRVDGESPPTIAGWDFAVYRQLFANAVKDIYLASWDTTTPRYVLVVDLPLKFQRKIEIGYHNENASEGRSGYVWLIVEKIR